MTSEIGSDPWLANKLSSHLIAYSFDGAVIVGLLIICTCAYLKRVPRINAWLLSEKKGFFGIFYKVKILAGSSYRNSFALLSFAFLFVFCWIRFICQIIPSFVRVTLPGILEKSYCGINDYCEYYSQY
uniref:Protein kish-B n=1 Tax=Wuchereria bancrofti TaxID=6293 RepID=A0A1I8EZ84_WUCBA